MLIKSSLINLIILFLFVIHVITSLEQCNSKETCSSCLSLSNQCAWCTQNSTDMSSRNGSFFHCDTIDNLQLTCSDHLISFQSYHYVLQNDSLSNAINSTSQAVQLSPQAVHVVLRINDSEKIPIKFRQAEDYPVDLYFLMDLSHSMLDDKEKLSYLGRILATQMQSITKNFRLGFGSFVDKNVPPFVQPAPNTVERPCPSSYNGPCVKAYGFKNHMSLSDNVAEFEYQVREAPVSGNIDAPEGGLDAIMQAIVCDDVIGWRNDSRKLIVFSTDAGFHYAGDGRLAGIIEPNDGKCHMANNEYTHSDKQDYPSIGQISAKLSEKNVNIIFAVTQSQLALYQTLTELIDGAVVGELKQDSSNIVNLISQNYRKISSSVMMMISNDLPDGLAVKFTPDCQENKRDKPECTVNVGGVLNFEVEILATKCVNNGAPTTFSIYTHGLNDKMRITVQTNCTCSCSKFPRQVNSPQCSNHGTYECGVCTCAKGFYGRECECDTASPTVESKIQQCKKPGSSDICSGRGQCVCGRCKCETATIEPGQRIYGDYCECDDFSCPRKNDLVCSGPEHGLCGCDKRCKCREEWTGDDCSCTTKTDGCLVNNTICNNQGVCECGRCKCHKDSGYLGPTCEDCPTCEHRCTATKDCVLCKVFHSGSLSEEQCEQCPYRFEIIDDARKDRYHRLCQFDDEQDQCRFFYTYHTEKDQLVLRVQKTKNCRRILSVRSTIIIIVSSILAFGLFCLMVWRMLATLHDRREFAKFEQEREKAKWETDVNPLYRQATVKYQNPTYRGYKFNEMRLMDHHENPQTVKRDNSNHSSPIPTPSPPPNNLRVNSTVRLTTIFDTVRTGKVVAFDNGSNLVTLHMKGSKPGLTSIAVINLIHCREWTVVQESNDETLEPLYPIDINKVKKRQTENENEKKKEASFVNLKASRIGQALFRDIKKTMNQVIRWSNNDILINNTVRIVDPYRAENVSIDAPTQSTNAANSKASAKGDNDTKTHIIKLVEKFWLDQSKVPSNTDSKSNTRTESATKS
ncbi:unnamed protein product [Adineta ricciae]|uniref:Integrin beta n=1 Tax=Adineta ricciae TaxID=249248 RepID=A0A815F9G5_ADIRI|nr:unnamed protein product [Adineta ricciae]CAF1322468.1 unnamed protein product [Adineta ricciae]